jgi:hypothetical protein
MEIPQNIRLLIEALRGGNNPNGPKLFDQYPNSGGWSALLGKTGRKNDNFRRFRMEQAGGVVEPQMTYEEWLSSQQ